MRTLIFGAGTDASLLLNRGLGAGETLIGFLDNNPAMQGRRVRDLPVWAPDEVKRIAFDRIRIACPPTMKVRRQLLDLGVPEEKMTSPLLDLANCRRLDALRNRHRGRPAVIVGNGPSLRLADLDRLADRPEFVTFAFNKIFLAYDQTRFRPTYYMVEDWLVAENNAEAITAVSGSEKLIPEIMLRFLRPTPDLTIFGLLYEFGPDVGRELVSEDPFDFAWGASVVHTAIQWAWYLGCEPLYLLGVDFKFEVPSNQPDQILVGRDTEQNHFIANYRGPGERWNRPMFERTRLAYEADQAHAQRTARPVFNATRGGALEIFPRVDFDQLVPARPSP